MAKFPPGVPIPSFQRGNQFEGWSIISTHSIATTGPSSGIRSRSSRIEFYVPSQMTEIAALFDNRQTLSNTESPFYWPITVGASLQRLGASIDQNVSDINIPMLINGKRKSVIAPGGTALARVKAELSPGRNFICAYAAAGVRSIPATPTMAAISGAGLAVGTFAGGYIVVYPDGSESPCSAAVTVTTTSGNQQVQLTGPAAGTFEGASGWLPMFAARGAVTPLYDIGADLMPFGASFTYSREPSNFTPLRRILPNTAPAIPLGGGVNGGTAPGGSNNGEFSLDNIDLTGTSWTNPGGVRSTAYGPAIVLGRDPARVWPSLAVLGDSIPTATADYGLGTNVGGFAVRAVLGQTTNRAYDPSIVPKIGYVLLSQGGETAAQFAGSSGLLRSELAGYATTVLIAYGTNDLTAGTSATSIIGLVLAIGSRFPRQQVRIKTLLPRATSSDGWMTVANQTIGNQSLEGNRRQFNAWASSDSTTLVTGEVPYTVAAGAATPATNFYSGGDGGSTIFLPRRPFVAGTEAVRVAGVIKSLTTDYTYYGAAIINGVQYASGVVFSVAPASGVTFDYVPMPLVAALGGTNHEIWDTSDVLEVNAAGSPVKNGGWWAPGAGGSLVSGTSSGSNSTVLLNDTSKAWATNQYRGYCVRIVTDTTTPAAVGQMGVIASNTATQLALGGTGFILGTAQGVTPSAAATYQIIDPKTLDGTHPTTLGAMLEGAAIPIDSVT